MKRISIHVTITVIIYILLIMMVIVLVNTTHSKTVLTKELEEKLLYFTESSTYKLSETFTKQQEIVNTMATFVGNSFVANKYYANPEVLEEKHIELDAIIRDMIEKNPFLASVYFTFDTQKSKGEDEIWYARIDDEVIKADYSDYEYMWEVRNEVTESSYYNALKKSPVWGDVYYEPVLKSDVLSYVSAVYDKENDLIGVAGVDVSVNNILEKIDEINEEVPGDIILVDSNFKYITGSTSSEYYKTNIKERIKKSDKVSSAEPGIINLKNDSLKTFAAYAPLSNGWHLIITQSQNTVLAPITSIWFVVIISAFIILLLTIFFASYYSKRTLRPLESEYEKKDIFIHAQERSARMGEMLSNIAHQWKQPLNSMVINISNLEDDYRDNNLDIERFNDYTDTLNRTISNMSKTVDDFANFLKPDKNKELFSINKEINKALSITKPIINKNSIRVEFYGESIYGYGYKNEYAQVIINIINNAVNALSKTDQKVKVIKIVTETGMLQDSIVKIFNNGPAISGEHLGKLFQPYFSTNTANNASGLGLYMSREIIEKNMDGDISIYNTDHGVECCINIQNENKDNIKGDW